MTKVEIFKKIVEAYEPHRLHFKVAHYSPSTVLLDLFDNELHCVQANRNVEIAFDIVFEIKDFGTTYKDMFSKTIGDVVDVIQYKLINDDNAFDDECADDVTDIIGELPVLKGNDATASNVIAVDGGELSDGFMEHLKRFFDVVTEHNSLTVARFQFIGDAMQYVLYGSTEESEHWNDEDMCSFAAVIGNDAVIEWIEKFKTFVSEEVPTFETDFSQFEENEILYLHINGDYGYEITIVDVKTENDGLHE